jgi:hypothetical protein
LRTEQRRFVREQKMLFANRKCLVLQERLYFRNLPLCNWVEHEVPIEEGADLESLVKTLAVFSPEVLPPAPRNGANAERKHLPGARGNDTNPLSQAVSRLLS